MNTNQMGVPAQPSLAPAEQAAANEERALTVEYLDRQVQLRDELHAQIEKTMMLRAETVRALDDQLHALRTRLAGVEGAIKAIGAASEAVPDVAYDELPKTQDGAGAPGRPASVYVPGEKVASPHRFG